jgi:CubicO group peptidase (beta-lactamase class C family)
MAYACLIDESDKELSLMSPIYDFIPDEFHVEDERRRTITIEQLLSMTSGLRGISSGGVGMGVPYGHGAFEYALGHSPNRRGYTCDLIAEPGTRFDYCDAGYSLLSLVFYFITGEDMRDYVNRKIFSKIGIENFHWDLQGGNGFIGPYTNAHTGLHLTVRDLARLGYLLLQSGEWAGERILPKPFFDQVARENPVNPRYVNGFWKNHDRRLILGAPEDTYYMNGFRSNRCYIIPSLDLVISRCGTGPAQWHEGKMIEEVLASIV